MSSGFTIFAGSANPSLARAMARALGVQVGACMVDRFPDGEVAVQLREPVRRREVFLVQPTSPPVNDHLIELLAFADACLVRMAEIKPDACIWTLDADFGVYRKNRRQTLALVTDPGWEGDPAAEPILIAAARYLAAHTPTPRAQRRPTTSPRRRRSRTRSRSRRSPSRSSRRSPVPRRPTPR